MGIQKLPRLSLIYFRFRDCLNEIAAARGMKRVKDV